MSYVEKLYKFLDGVNPYFIFKFIALGQIGFIFIIIQIIIRFYTELIITNAFSRSFPLI